jgi:uncharacterized protein (TIGR03085 family)
VPSNQVARAERAAICELLTELGPDRPTLCTGWRTRDLAAHLILRERRPLAALGIAVRRLAGRTARAQRTIAERPFPVLVETLRHPPRWSPMSLPAMDRAVNTLEMFIHHEDIRRAQPDWGPRPLVPALAGALWPRVRALARLRLRHFHATIHIEAPGFGETGAGSGVEEVRVSGDPGELALFFTGRQRAARVQLTGPPAHTDWLQRIRMGL